MQGMHTVRAVTPSNDLLRWLARAMIAARKREGLEPIDVAQRARVRAETVERWERGEHWPRYLDKALDAYASLAKLGGRRDVCELALDLWREDDAARATQRAEAEAVAAAADTTPLPDESPETPDAKPSDGEAA